MWPEVYELIKKHEGLRLKKYLCSQGYPTIGYGHKMINNEYEEITLEKAQELLEEDVEEAYNSVLYIFPSFGGFSLNRKAALIDMTFQLGASGLKHFKKAVTLTNLGAWNEAADEYLDSLWARQTPNRAKEVTDMIREG